MSRLDDAFRKFLIPESVWSWDEAKLAELNDAATYERLSKGLDRLNEAIDFLMWQREIDG